MAEGRRVVVDMDLEKFFDRVNHDILMGKMAEKVGDGWVLKLIRRYLEAGMMADGIVSPRTQGTPQGGPLSPLLSNILLTELDRELERRGHAFCRYADDCNIYVGSQAAGERVLAGITRFLAERLKLGVNEAKSAVAPLWKRKFLGYSLAQGPAAAGRVEQPETAARQDPRSAQGCERAKPATDHRRTESGPARLGGLLQADRDHAGAGGDRWLAQAQAALPPVAAMEAPLHSRQEPDEGRSGRGAGISLGLQPTRAVVEQWCQPHERGFAQVLL